MSEALTLPAVATKIYIECKKCVAERYFVVMAHKTSDSAKVQCEICKAIKTYKLPKTRKPPSEKALKALAGAAAKRRATSLENKKNIHMNEYNNLIAAAAGDAQNYSMKNKFTVNQKVQHPKFGLGIIKMALFDKIEVIFPDEIRLLVHNRA